MVIAATFLRVSSGDSNDSSTRTLFAQYLVRRGWTQGAEVLPEEGRAVDEKRRGLKRVLDVARSQRCNVVVVQRALHLVQSMRELVVALGELDRCGVGFASIEEPALDTTTSAALVTLARTFGQLEHEAYVESTARALAKAQRRGAGPGRPRAVSDARVFRLRSRGLSAQAIADQLHAGKATIIRVLKRTENPLQILTTNPRQKRRA